MKMEVLRGKSPAMVRKEVALHLLASNLIRGLMAEAARVGDVKPRQFSFRGPSKQCGRLSRRIATTRFGSRRTFRG